MRCEPNLGARMRDATPLSPIASAMTGPAVSQTLMILSCDVSGPIRIIKHHIVPCHQLGNMLAKADNIQGGIMTQVMELAITAEALLEAFLGRASTRAASWMCSAVVAILATSAPLANMSSMSFSKVLLSGVPL